MFKHKSGITRVFSKRKKMAATECQEGEPPDTPSTSNAASTRDRKKDSAGLQGIGQCRINLPPLILKGRILG